MDLWTDSEAARRSALAERTDLLHEGEQTGEPYARRTPLRGGRGPSGGRTALYAACLLIVVTAGGALAFYKFWWSVGARPQDAAGSVKSELLTQLESAKANEKAALAERDEVKASLRKLLRTPDDVRLDSLREQKERLARDRQATLKRIETLGRQIDAAHSAEIEARAQKEEVMRKCEELDTQQTGQETPEPESPDEAAPDGSDWRQQREDELQSEIEALHRRVQELSSRQEELTREKDPDRERLQELEEQRREVESEMAALQGRTVYNQEREKLIQRLHDLNRRLDAARERRRHLEDRLADIPSGQKGEQKPAGPGPR